MENPKISIIIPVYNAEQSLEKTIQAIQAQTFTDYEVICVDDGSTDNSLTILQGAAEEDGRFLVLHQEHSGAGAARNRGMEIAKGEYLLFSDCDDLYAEACLEKLCQTAVTNDADIAVCNFAGLDAGGREVKQKGIHNEWLPKDCAVFSYRDCPVNILRIASPVVWNKLYRKAFILQNNLKFDQLQTCNDLAFVAVSLACAERVAYTTEHLVRYHFPRLNNPKRLEDVCSAIKSTVGQIQSLPHGEILRDAVYKFAVENYISALKKSVRDFSEESAARFYQTVHEAFNSGELCELKPENLQNRELYNEFLTVKKHDYETMKKLVSRRIIVSMTSYPRRIGAVAKALESIYAQTRKADEIVLWLAEDQFPGKLEELPQELQRLVDQKRLTVRWCEDLKGHKKYFYALQEYTEDVVVTVDDDLLYPKDMLAVLYKSYLLHPNAVSTMRAHLITVSDQNQIMPYREWVQETDACIHEPSMQLMASGGAGDLYPPDLYRKEFFDVKAAKELCLWADNIWVKVMELISDVPVVLAKPSAPLCCVDGTQEETLFQINGDLNQYDVQLQKISEWLDGLFWKGILNEKLTASQIGKRILGTEAVTAHVNKERKVFKAKALRTERELQQVKEEQKRLQDSLNQAESKEKQTRELLTQTQKELRRAEGELGQTRNRLRQAEDSKPIKRQLKELGNRLQSQKAEDGASFGWYVKYLLYLLAWVPEVLLGGMMFLLENGFAQTAKYTFGKLFRRKS